jgi:hypothetical protein
MAFGEEIDEELSRRLEDAARLVEDAQVQDVAAARWFAMQLEINTAIKDAIVEVAKRLVEMDAGASD